MDIEQNPLTERLDIVDAHDDLLGSDTRENVHKKNLLHRAVFVMVFNPEGKLFVQKRSYDKDVYEGLLEGSVSGHVLSGEDYRKAALRELREELGIVIAPAKMDELLKFGIHDEQERAWVKLYLLKDYKGDIKLDRTETLEGSFWSMEKVKTETGKNSEQFSPVFLQALKLIKDLREEVKEYLPL